MNKQNSEFTIDFLKNKSNYYLANNKNITYKPLSETKLMDFALYHIDEITFDDKAPRKEALENVLSSMKIDGINFIYLILGDKKGVHFYYGVSRDKSTSKNLGLTINEIGKYILEPGIKGNFRGSKVEAVSAEGKKEILETINSMNNCGMLEGVPGYVKDDEKFQGVDRLVDVMLGDTFGLMIIASPINYNEIKSIEENLYEVYRRIVPLSKTSRQSGTQTTKNESKSISKGTSKSESENYSITSQESNSHSEGLNTGQNHSQGSSNGTSDEDSNSSTNKSAGKSSGKSVNDSKTMGGSESHGTNYSTGENSGISTQTGSSTGSSNTESMEFVDKASQDWLKYLDDIIIPRLDYGTGKGIFITASFLFAHNEAVLKKLENTAISLYSGETGNKIPLMDFSLDERTNLRGYFRNFQLPCGSFVSEDELAANKLNCRSALSQYVAKGQDFLIGNWITTNELAMIAGLPKKEVVGLGLKEEVEFGLNLNNDIKAENKINLGKLVQSGNIIDEIEVSIDKENLDKHTFITGVTGSGKTTTCHKILIDSGLPFLIIEPAKTEYRILADTYDDILVFTPGNDSVAPFRLNPFEFFRHESITSRVDMIRASIEASFDMEAAIPQLIETAIYECYEDYGWDIATNKNEIYGDKAFDDGIYAFPTLEDLMGKIDTVVEKQGFDVRLKNDYIGSIRARLQSLLMGAKGHMLNTRRSIDFEALLDRRVVLELEEIRSATEKSLVMGFILTNLIEAIKARFFKKGAHSHITLVEEAHRLLSKFSPGDSPNKKHGVETFTDMLAEIRKYGEALVIVDQIPNKLTPEILKNTNTKIVHKIFAEDDKEAIGNNIVLNKEQREFLSNLETGRAILFTQGLNKSVQVQIEKASDTTSQKQITRKRLRNAVMEYYAEEYKKGIIFGSLFFDERPSVEDMEKLFSFSVNKEFTKIAYIYFSHNEFNTKAVEELYRIFKKYSAKTLKTLMSKMLAKADDNTINAINCITESLGDVAAAGYILAEHYVNINKQNTKDFDKKKKYLLEFMDKYREDDIKAADLISYKTKFMEQ